MINLKLVQHEKTPTKDIERRSSPSKDQLGEDQQMKENKDDERLNRMVSKLHAKMKNNEEDIQQRSEEEEDENDEKNEQDLSIFLGKLRKETPPFTNHNQTSNISDVDTKNHNKKSYQNMNEQDADEDVEEEQLDAINEVHSEPTVTSSTPQRSNPRNKANQDKQQNEEEEEDEEEKDNDDEEEKDNDDEVDDEEDQNKTHLDDGFVVHQNVIFDRCLQNISRFLRPIFLKL